MAAVDAKEHSKTMKPKPESLPSGNSEACSGCGACAAICPKDCITMQPDDEGFLYPVTDAHECNDCGLCRQICPVHLREKSADNGRTEECGAKPPAVFAAWHLDEDIRRNSSSGGVFTALAENILAQGGSIVGAAFDDQFVVRHMLIDSSEELHRIRGTKYVQSDVSPLLCRQIRDRLKRGQPILFSGTPCQVAGLRNFLRQNYESLFCADLVCHGVPSPWLFARYIEEQKRKHGKLKSVNFRDKLSGWKNYRVQLLWPHGKQYMTQSEQYMAAFLRNYSLRPSCYNCCFANTTRPGDLTLADFWGVERKYPEYDRENKGTSLVLVNTEKGKAWLDGCQSRLFLGSADLDTAVAGNPMLVRPCPRSPEREMFYVDLKTLPFEAMVHKYRLHGPTRFRRLAAQSKQKLKAVICRLLCGMEGGSRK
jgi:coenzyme F420-reducing hydrogenase beta subunit